MERLYDSDLAWSAEAVVPRLQDALLGLVRELPGPWTARPCVDEPSVIEVAGPCGFIWPIGERSEPAARDSIALLIQRLLDELRLSAAPDDEESSDAPAARERSIPSVRSGSRILIFEPDSGLRTVLVDVLEDAGYAALATGDADELAQALLGSQSVLLIVDLDHAQDLQRHLAMIADLPPVVGISGRTPIDVLVSAPLRSLLWAHLSKPLSMDLLVRTCDRALLAAQSEGAAPPVERRAQRRRCLMTPVSLVSVDGVAVARGQLINLSTRGAQVDLGVPLASASRVRLAIDLLDGEPPLTVWGEVRWRDRLVFGVEFVDLTTSEEGRLRRALSALRRVVS